MREIDTGIEREEKTDTERREADQVKNIVDNEG